MYLMIGIAKWLLVLSVMNSLMDMIGSLKIIPLMIVRDMWCIHVLSVGACLRADPLKFNNNVAPLNADKQTKRLVDEWSSGDINIDLVSAALQKGL